jgi:lipopolysaccharide/colanic/teichoic acid biosynthesis glycosyltransferase
MKALGRVFNAVAALAGLVVLSPLFALVALAIKCNDRGPVFYSQLRMGQGFRPFHLLKFRSMIRNAERDGLLTRPGDSRVTRAGCLLRRYKLDELPQLWNVLTGDMQLVGARPEVERYVRMFPEEYGVLLREPPGITDPASLAYRHEEKFFVPGEVEQQYLDQILPDKLKLSLEYQQRRTLGSDIRVLVATLLALYKRSPTHLSRTNPLHLFRR